MIDIQPFISKLDKLREYMEYFTQWNGYTVWMDLQVCPDDFYIKQNLPLPKPYEKTITPVSFNEWYELNKN